MSNVFDPLKHRPFNHDGEVYPEHWKVYGEDMERYERAKKIFDQPTPVRTEAPERVTYPRNENAWVRRY